jgi:hypothetical protein
MPFLTRHPTTTVVFSFHLGIDRRREARRQLEAFPPERANAFLLLEIDSLPQGQNV